MSDRLIDAETFERQYAARAGVTVDQLRAWGRVVRPCDCGEPICEGWQSVNLESYNEDQAMRDEAGWPR